MEASSYKQIARKKLRYLWLRLHTKVSRNSRLLNRSFRTVDNLYLNVGCGRSIQAHCVNIDYYQYPGVNLCWDVGRGKLPFADRSVLGIFTEHCLEHLDLHACKRALAEFHRVMKTAGVLRIIVPDGEVYIDRYVAKRSRPELQMPFADSREEPTGMFSVNRIFRAHGHQFIHDFSTLRVLLAETGFQAIQRVAFGQGRDPKLLLDTERRKVESLYVECIK